MTKGSSGTAWLVAVVVFLVGAVCAQEAEFRAPEGWVVSPANEKAEGEAGYRVLQGQTGIQMVWVPGGSFAMGSDSGLDDERPIHRVELDGFWIGWTEVTVGQWRSVMGSMPEGNDFGDDHPVVNVSWEDCRDFCNRAGLALPTEAQWEYAARGPEGREYPWGDEWDAALCQSDEDRHGHDRTAPVGTFPGGASWCGALDMAGNVWEWCSDWYDDEFYKTPAAAVRDPVNSRDGLAARAYRGGSWHFIASICRSAYRSGGPPGFQMASLGFRVAVAVSHGPDAKLGQAPRSRRPGQQPPWSAHRPGRNNE